MDRRYQVFVSSTYADLKEERRQVTQALMEMDCMPAGMELFPAADEEQFEFIKRIIEDCDYYLLIIGGRYGSTTNEGISYTEKEYEYAVERGLRVIALIHEDPNAIPFGKSEADATRRERLEEFRSKVSSNRLVKFWKSSDQLPGLVSLSLNKTIKMFPAVGWIRANKVGSEELLAELNELRKQSAQLREKLATMNSQPAVENLAGLEDEMTLGGTYRNKYYNGRIDHWKATVRWSAIFASIAPYLIRIPNDSYVKSILERDMFPMSETQGQDPHLGDQVFRTVGIQLQALRLVLLQYSETVGGSMDLFWSLTPQGERLMVELRTVKKPNASSPAGSNIG
jgi:hypothetical protein